MLDIHLQHLRAFLRYGGLNRSFLCNFIHVATPLCWTVFASRTRTAVGSSDLLRPAWNARKGSPCSLGQALRSDESLLHFKLPGDFCQLFGGIRSLLDRGKHNFQTTADVRRH